jgi:uncharacterized protein with GYD domain
MTDIKKEMKDRARLARGLANALGYDVEYIYTDVENYDLVCMSESIRETKDTIQKLIDNVMELEYLLYLLKNEDSRDLHTPL